MQEKEKIPLIFQTINSVLKDVTAIGKDKKNTQQGYSFRGIDDLYNELHGLFAKHGLFCTSELVGSLREERTSKSGGATIYSIIDIKFTFYLSRKYIMYMDEVAKTKQMTKSGYLRWRIEQDMQSSH